MTSTALPFTAVEVEILSPEAREFLNDLARNFEKRRQELLARRDVGQKQIDAGQLPDFLPETAEIRKSATAEISCAQVWQWVRHGARISDDGRPITQEMVRALVTEQKKK